MDKRTVKNFLYHGAYQLLNMLLPLATMPYLARIIGPDGMGTYSYWFNLAHYFVLFSRLGLNEYGNRTVAAIREDREALSRTFWSIYAMQLIASGICLTVYLLLFIGKGGLAWAAALYVLSGMFDIGWMFFGLERFRFTVVRGTLVKLGSTLLIFLLVRDSGDLPVYCLIMTGSILAGQMALWPRLLTLVDLYRPGLREIAVHVRPNLLLFIPTLSVSLYKVMDKLMLGALSDTAQLGCYEAAEQVLNVPVSLVRAFGAVMLPRAANLASRGKGDPGELQTGVRIAMFLACSMSLGLVAVAKEFVPAFFGPDFADCGRLLYILAPSTIFIALSNVLRTQYLIPTCRDRIFTRSVLSGAVCNLALNALLIPGYQAAGAAVGTLCAEFTVLAVQLHGVRHRIHTAGFLKSGLPCLCAGIIMLALIGRLRAGDSLWLTIAVKVAAGGAIYLLLTGLYYGLSRRLAGKYRGFRARGGGPVSFCRFLWLRRRWGTTEEEFFRFRLCRLLSRHTDYFRGTVRFSRSWKAVKPEGLPHSGLRWLDFGISRLLCPGLDGQDYFAYGFPGMPLDKRRTFITEGGLARMDRHFNFHSPACAHRRELLCRKDRFNAHFADMVGRRWMLCDDETGPEEREGFCRGLTHVMVKPVDGLRGSGIEKLTPEAVKDRKGCFLLEEVLTQHPSLASFHPASVNSIRVYTVEHGGQIHITGATLRMGTRGVTDNYSAGGIAAEIDPATGRVTSTGVCKTGERFRCHPVSGVEIPGFQVPHWDRVTGLVRAAHLRVLPLRYIGWDVCVDEGGQAVLVEANTGAGVGLQQHPSGTGKKALYRALW